ncbi:hypothetical protein STRDD11_01480 [Streptococcus sp. DD11]|nr:hypothetical protein STRDD11_01480 [Streptococcus sp. DD11]
MSGRPSKEQSMKVRYSLAFFAALPVLLRLLLFIEQKECRFLVCF